MNSLTNNLSNMDLSNDDEELPQYFGGIYTIWKGQMPIYVNYFIYEDYEANTEYKADLKLWESHSEDFRKNPFSELNQAIKNIDDKNIEIQIVDCHLFNNDEVYVNIKGMLKDELRIYQLSHSDNNENVIKKRKDNYNMTDLLEALETCLFMDEIFGEEMDDD